jgi:hypothetical protein
LNASLHVTFDRFGAARAYGVVVLRSGADTEVFIADPEDTNASCADQNGNGVGGLTALQVGFQNERSEERISVAILPHVELDEDGRYTATLHIGDLGMEVVLVVRTCDRPAGCSAQR